jgi:ZIP family zinc transporter
MPETNPILIACLLSLFAGLGTGLGGLIAVVRTPGKRSFGFIMGITAGVMLTLAFHQLVNEAWELAGFFTATMGFAAGAIVMLALDMLIPHIRFGQREPSTPEEAVQPVEEDGPWRGRRGRGRRWGRHRHRAIDRQLLHAGALLSLGITLHNIPEGIAVGAGYIHMPDFGVMISVAILLHNIPEGIGTALPLAMSGVGRWQAFWVALLSGLAEPIGALAAAAVLSTFSTIVPAALAFAGGVMVFITLDELLPMARQYGHQHYTAVGIILGAILVFLLSGLFGV